MLYIAVDFLAHYWDLNLSLSNIVAFYLYQAPGVFQQFMPVACLMSVLLVLSAMSRQSEILALHVGGVSSLRVMATLLAITSVITVVTFVFFDSWVPFFEKKRALVRQGLDPSHEHLLLFGNQRFWYRTRKAIYNIGRYVPESNVLEDLNVYLLNDSFGIRERLSARRARYSNNDWILEEGFSVVYPESHFPIASSFESRTGLIPETPEDFKMLRFEETMMRLKDLRKYIERNQSYGLDTTEQQVNYHERMALVFTPLIFVLLAGALVISPLRSFSAVRSTGLCFAIVFTYLLLFRLSLSVGKGGSVPPVLAGWSTNAVFLAVAVMLIRKRK
jgi:lipopolysaccharide export system permease protein